MKIFISTNSSNNFTLPKRGIQNYKGYSIFRCFYNVFHNSFKNKTTISPLPFDPVSTSTPIYEKNRIPSHYAVIENISDTGSSSHDLQDTRENIFPINQPCEKTPPVNYKRLYPFFYQKNVKITKYDCDLIEMSWNIVLTGDLHYFKRLKEEQQISQKKNSVSWFYDTFYALFYSYDEINNTNMAKIFKRNMKIQSHALVMIIKNCIKLARAYSIGQKFDFQVMHKSHDVFGMIYEHYIIISIILISAFEKCLREQWTHEMEHAWTKTITLLLRGIIPHFTHHVVPRHRTIDAAHT